jgi:thiamine biosynthesis lipoprotein
MGGAARITFYLADDAAALSAAKAAFERIDELERAMSDYRADSPLSALNRGAGGAPQRVGLPLLGALVAAKRLAEETDGAFDPTVGPVVALWRRARKSGQMPPPAERDAAVALVGWRGLEIDQAAGTARLARPGMALDLGGFGKGYAADQARRLLLVMQVHRCLVGLGGDYAAGDPPPGVPGWSIGFKDDAPPIELANACVSTSGADEQFVEFGGKRYSHIVDPRTGLGLEQHRRFTVVAPAGGTADALATAASVLDVVRAKSLCEKFHGVRLYVDGVAQE